MKNLIGFVIVVSFSLVIMISCENKKEGEPLKIQNASMKTYSQFFTIDTSKQNVQIVYNEHKKLTVVFDTTLSKSFQSNDTVFIHTFKPKVALNSTTFVGFLKVINVENSIVGFQNKNLVYDSVMYNKLLSNEIVDIHTPEGINIELLLQLRPTIVFLTYSPGFETTTTIDKLQENGVIVIQIPDWLEQHPLGRMEWVKVFSMFYNTYPVASDFSQKVIETYDSLKKSIWIKSSRPKVMIGLSFNDQWYVPSGSGYFGKLLFDAGFAYPFAETNSIQSLALSKEEILSMCSDSEYWINVTTATTLKDVKTIERLAPNFLAFQKGNVFNYTKTLLPRGANDFWESGVVHPDKILSDLLWISSGFPETYSPYYYTKLP